MISVSQYFFLLYRSNPIRSRVQIYVDGDSTPIHMSHDSMIDLVVNTAGFTCEAAVRSSLLTYGTFWLFDRDSNTVRQISPSGGQDIINRAQELKEGAVAQSEIPASINPAERYAGVTTKVPAMDDLKTIYDNTQQKKKTSIGISIPFGR